MFELLMASIGIAVIAVAVRSRRAATDNSPEAVRARGGHVYNPAVRPVPAFLQPGYAARQEAERLTDRELAMDIWAQQMIEGPDVHEPLLRDPRKHRS